MIAPMPPTSVYGNLLLCLGLCRLERALLFRNLEQCWIKLNERVVDGAVLRMAGQAFGGCGIRRLRRLIISAEREESPSLLEAALVFHFGFDADQVTLKMSGLVDRAARACRAEFQNEHRLVRPLAGFQK